MRNFMCRSCKTVNPGTPSPVDRNRYECPTCSRCGDFEGTPTDEPITPRFVDEHGHVEFEKSGKQQPQKQPLPPLHQPPAPAALPHVAADVPIPEVSIKYDIGIDIHKIYGLEPGKIYLVEISGKKKITEFQKISKHLVGIGLALGVKFIPVMEGSIVNVRGVQTWGGK